MSNPSEMMRSGVSAMYYSHDSFGLGHLRRTLTLANHLRETMPGISQLIVTGSPVANRFPFPAGTDYVKLPSVTKDLNGDYMSRSLAIGLEPIRDMRQDILFSVARHFQPDFLLVDHTPGGLRGEAVKTLRHLKQEFPQTKLIVGLRDVLDEAATVRRAWMREDVHALLDDVYDLILVYGRRAFYDVVAEYGLSAHAAEKTRFVGYLGRKPGSRSRAEVRASLGLQTDKLVVVTAGGGGDSEALYDPMLRDMQLPTAGEFDCLIVGGPLLAESARARVGAARERQRNLHFVDATEDLPSYLGAADAVLTMGGYNTVCEALSLGQPTTIVPRTRPRQEQLIRARFLSERGLIRMLHPSELTSGRLLAEVRALLRQPAGDRPLLAMDGLDNVTSAIGSLLRRGQPGAAATPPGRYKAASGSSI